MRDFPMFMVNPRLSEAKKDVLMRLYSDAIFDAKYERGRNQWSARRHAENCRLLAAAFGTPASADVKRHVRRARNEARRRRSDEQLAKGVA